MEEISKAIENLEEEKLLSLVKEKLNSGEDPVKILEACRIGIARVGSQSEEGTLFLTDLIMAGEMFKEAMELLIPKLKSGATESKGKILIGTVEGDIHNIGKDITITFLEAEGFEVVDLGVDVPVDKFVEAVKEQQPQVLGLSGLLTLSIEPMKKTIQAIKDAGLAENMKIIVGGTRMDQEVSEYVGADAWVVDAVKGVRTIKNWMGVEA